MSDPTLVATLMRYGVAHLKTKPNPYLWHYKRAETLFLTKTWRVDYSDSVAAYEGVMQQVCPLKAEFPHTPYLGELVVFVKEQCRGKVGFYYSSFSEGSTSSAWFSELHDLTLYKLTFS